MELPELGETVSLMIKGRPQSLTLRMKVINPDDSITGLLFRDIRNHPVYIDSAYYLALAGCADGDDNSVA